MNFSTKNITEKEYSFEEQIYEDALMGFAGGQPLSHTKGFEDDYYNIKRLLKDVGNLVLAAEGEAKEKINTASKVDDDSDSTYWDAVEASATPFSYRQYTYKSFLYLVHAIFENRIMELAQILHKHKAKKDVNLPKNNAKLHSFINFLKKHIEEDVDSIFPEREQYNEIRNAIYHRDGVLDIEKVPLAWIASKQGIIYRHSAKHEKDQLLITGSAFILDYLEQVKKTLDALYKKASSL